MSFWTAEQIKKTLGGTWLARGDEQRELEGASTDTRALRPGQVFVALRGESTDGHKYLAQAAAAGAGMLIVDDAAAVAALGSRGDGSLPVTLRVDDTGAALLKLAGAYRRTLERTKVIAVGGSNGKTTTVKLIHQVLGTSLKGTASIKSFNNAVGVPLTILSARRTDQYLICEVGTNAPGEIAPLAAVVEPDIAVLTSIGREHLEGLGSLAGVVQEEVSLLQALRPGGTAVLPSEAPELLEAARVVLNAIGGRPIIGVGVGEGADIRVTECVQRFEGLRFCINGRQWYDLPLLGAHNAGNAAMAVAVARKLGLDNDAIVKGLAGAKGAEMRLERVIVEVETPPPGGRGSGGGFVRRGGEQMPLEISDFADSPAVQRRDALLQPTPQPPPSGRGSHTPVPERGGNQGIRFINDAYNANPESALAALRTFAEVAAEGSFARRVLVLGDMLELGAAAPELHAEIGEAAAAARADLVVLVGTLSAHTAERLRAAQPGVRIESIMDLSGGRDAEAAALLRGGDLVLLKGSRRMALERIIAAAKARHGVEAPLREAKPVAAGATV